MMLYLKVKSFLAKRIDKIVKKLEARKVAKLSTNIIGSDFCEQAHETGACLPASLGLSEEQVNYMGVVAGQKRYPFSNNFNSGWPNRQNFFASGGNNFQPS